MSPSALPSPLKTADWLTRHLSDPSLRVLDCRYALLDPLLGRLAYLEGHVPGAAYADLEMDLSGPVSPDGAGGRHPLPDPAELAGWLGRLGVGNEHVVLCYDDPGSGQGFTAARAWWLLRWLGHREVYVLDGGWPAYLAAGGTPSTEEAAYPEARFVPDVQPGWVATAEDVAARGDGVTLLDARAPERYRGEVEPLDAKAGHIPGALNEPWTGALEPSGHWRAPRPPRAGPTIASCGSGVSAAALLLARELDGVPLEPDNRLYAGSWSDWISDASRPVALGEEGEG